MLLQRKIFIFISFLMFCFIVLCALGVNNAQAAEQTINCTGTETTTNTSYIFYDASAENCLISDARPSADLGDIFLTVTVNSAAGFIQFDARSDNNLDDRFSRTDHQGCVLAGTTIAAGVSCRVDNPTASTTFSNNSIVTNVSEGITATLKFTAIVGAMRSSLDLSNASVVLALPDAATSNANTPIPPVLQASVSRSQSKVVSTNIGTRLASIGSNPVGVGRTTPGTSRTTPTGGGVIGGGSTSGGTVSTPDASTNFETTGYGADANTSNSDGYDKFPLRKLAMMMSFDTSHLSLDGNRKLDALYADEVNAPQQRSDIETDKPFTLWGYGSYTDVENSRNDAAEDSRFNGDVWGYNVGADYQFRSNFYAGVSVGFSQTDIATIYNTGDYTEDSWTITPYAVYQVNDAFKLSGMFGYGYGKIDQSRDSGAVTSDTKSGMWFVAATGSYDLKPNPDLPLDLKTSLGVLVTDKKVSAYTESDGTVIESDTSNTFQLKPGLELAYSYGLDAKTVLQPFAKVGYIHDFKDPVNDDKSAFDLGGGLRIGSTTGFSGSIEGNTQVGRSDYKEHTISGLVAYSFAVSEEDTKNTAFLEPYLQSDFTQDTQVFGIGINFISHQDALNATLGIRQVQPTNDNLDTSEEINLTLKVMF